MVCTQIPILSKAPEIFRSKLDEVLEKILEM